MRMRAGRMLLAAGGSLLLLLAVTQGATAAPAKIKVTNVVVQGGTTPTDSGLLQNVIEPGFKKAYPQYNLEYISVGTGQAIMNAEAGEADAVFTHSPTLENGFVAGGYSYEPGGRLVMTSQFVTVGPPSDPAGVLTGPQNNVVAAFEEIAAAGAEGKANFVSRGDDSGTNVKELSIWALTNVPLNTLGEPGTPGTTETDAWYHTTGLGQGQNLQTTNQCPFTGGGCYTLTDIGTFNVLVANGTLTNLVIVSQSNNGAGALGGSALLINPYHAYAVNPAAEPGVNINLAGALAFLNYLTSPATQAAIGAYPSTTNPAFIPDARPIVTVTQGVPAKASASATLTVSGTDIPAYPLDPAITGAPVLLIRSEQPSVTIASTTVGAGGAFSLSFSPAANDTYELFFPEFHDNLVLPTNTGYRQSVTVDIGKLKVTPAVTLAVSGQTGLSVTVGGSAAPTTDRVKAAVQIQGKLMGAAGWQSLGSAISLPNGQATYSTSVTLPSAGTWSLRAQYSDPGVVLTGYSAISHVTAS